MKKNKVKIGIQVVSFILLGFILLQVLSYIFLPKWWTKEYINAVGTLTVKGFYEEKKNSLDMVFLGSSSVFCGISPMVLWEDHGITSYVLSTSEQKPITSYYMLKEVLQYQTPKVVVLDMNEAFNIYEGSANFTRKTYDNLKWGSTKVEAILDRNYHYNMQDTLSYFFPLFRYHTRWNELAYTDINFTHYDFHNATKGVYMSYQVKPYDINLKYMDKKDKTTSIDENSLAYFNKIVDLCKKNNIKLELIDMAQPPSWTQAKHDIVNQFANENNLEFIDFNLIDVGIDWNTDLKDNGYHFNLYGAEKTTRYLGNHLVSIYSFSDHRNDTSYDTWKRDFNQYEAEKQKLLHTNSNKK